MMEPNKSGLEKHIDEVSKQIEIPLKKHETTPGMGNCWYEACASLLKLNNMRDISAKQLRKEVVDNIENAKIPRTCLKWFLTPTTQNSRNSKRNITEKESSRMKMGSWY